MCVPDIKKTLYTQLYETTVHRFWDTCKIRSFWVDIVITSLEIDYIKQCFLFVGMGECRLNRAGAAK